MKHMCKVFHVIIVLLYFLLSNIFCNSVYAMSSNSKMHYYMKASMGIVLALDHELERGEGIIAEGKEGLLDLSTPSNSINGLLHDSLENSTLHTKIMKYDVGKIRSAELMLEGNRITTGVEYLSFSQPPSRNDYIAEKKLELDSLQYAFTRGASSTNSVIKATLDNTNATKALLCSSSNAGPFCTSMTSSANGKLTKPYVSKQEGLEFQGVFLNMGMNIFNKGNIKIHGDVGLGRGFAQELGKKILKNTWQSRFSISKQISSKSQTFVEVRYINFFNGLNLKDIIFESTPIVSLNDSATPTQNTKNNAKTVVITDVNIKNYSLYSLETGMKWIL